ncbi:MAG: hypothetical protein FIA96_01695 [Betaproteobacteria bacterium]|nr:hypothetical protein [Betaproteobacteria bacterium]
MAAKRILLLDGPLLTAHYWNAGHIKVEGEFSPEPVGLERLAAYLRKHRTSIFYLLADIAEEGFQLESLPFVRGGDRNALLQRRLGQYYYNTPLSAALSLGRAKDGRRDEKVLFAALTRIETFTPWLDTLRAAEANLAGVYSVPLVLAGCVGKLLGNGGPVLFVSLSRGGVRQSFFDEGKLHFSRLSPLATKSLEEVARTSASDSAKIYQYLLAQRQIPRGTPVRTMVMAHARQIPTLQEFCRSTKELQFEFIDLAAAARQQGLRDVPADSNADNLFIHCLATRTPARQFAPATDIRIHKLWQIRFALTSAAWLALAGCLLYAGKNGFTLYELRDSIEATKAATATDTRRYNAIIDSLPKVGISPDNLRALLERFEVLQKRAPAIEPLLNHLSLALNENPGIELASLTWKIADSLDAGEKAPDEARGKAGALPVAAAAGGVWAVIEINARLPLGMVNDQRRQIELIEGFAARLRAPRTDVRILSRPFDIESDKPLRSSSEKGEAQLADAPKFSLRLARLM